MSLLTIGTAAFDDIETPFGRAEMAIGGAAVYISWAASYFTRDVRMVSIVGEDFPSAELKSLNDRGVDTAGVEVVPGKKSFYWSGKYQHDMNVRDTLATDLNVLADFDPELPDVYRNSDYVMLGNLTPDVQLGIISQMQPRPRLIAMDTMNFWMDNALDKLLETLKHIDILIINDEEARQLSGEYSLVKAARKINGMGPKFLVIKKGEHGALLFNSSDIFIAPALPLAEVFDPTGAGDTFAGGFMGYLAKTRETSFENMKRAMIYGSAMASFCVEKFSLERLKDLTQEEIYDRVQKFRALTYFDGIEQVI
jgi:sugar/nucleoside kinase (ribokinase family)